MSSLGRWYLGALLAIAAAAPACAHPPRGIVVGADGTVYFSALTRVLAIAPSGRIETIHQPPGAHVHALALAADGALWGEQSTYEPASNSYREAIWRRGANGRVGFRYGPTSTIERGVGLLRDRKGCTWHLDQAGRGGPPLVHRRCGSAPASRIVGSAADDSRFQPVLVLDQAGTALDAQGRFVFRNRGALHRVDGEGRAEVLADSIDGGNFGIAMGPGGSVLVAEFTDARIVSVNRGQTRVLHRSQPGWAPSGVAWRHGALYVLEASLYRAGQPERLRVRKVGPGSAEKVLATLTI